MYKLKLYIVGETRTSTKLLDYLKDIFEKDLEEPYTLEVIDVLDHPEKAIDDEIFATPTLAKVHPEQVRKVIGDLNDREMLLDKLGLTNK